MPAHHHSALKARALKAHVKALRHYTVTNTVDYLQRQLATTSKYSRSPSLYFRRISSKYVNASFRVHIYSKLSCPPVASSRPHWENFIVHTADCKYKACVKLLDIKMTNPGNKLEQCDTATAAYNWHTPLMLCILLTKKSHEISNSLQSIAKAGCNGNKTDITSHNNWYKTHTHTHPFNGPFSRTTRVGWYQKGKTNLDFTEARDSEWQWHQLGICKSAPRSRQITTPAPRHSVFNRPDALPAAQPTASKHWRQNWYKTIAQ